MDEGKESDLLECISPKYNPAFTTFNRDSNSFILKWQHFQKKLEKKTNINFFFKLSVLFLMVINTLKFNILNRIESNCSQIWFIL